MPKKSKIDFPRLKRIEQLNDTYCGPAVLEMLLGFKGFKVTQEELVDAAGVRGKIKERGMTIEELAKAASLVPEIQFWYKRFSTIGQLSQLVNFYKTPVGVEWQGVFKEKDGRDVSDDDPGHYSVITAINTDKNVIMLADPYEDYAGRDRRFTILEFERRWWDINEIESPVSKQRYQIDDYHALFIITSKKETFPEQLIMEKG